MFGKCFAGLLGLSLGCAGALQAKAGYVYSDYSWKTYKGHEYAITFEYNKWTDAEAEAVAVGGHLATINDAAENAWLTDAFNGFYTRGIQHPSWSIAWIGMRRVGTEWGWASGEPVTYTAPILTSDGNWMPDNPQNHDDGGPHAYLHTANHFAPGTWANHEAEDWYPSWNPRGIIELDAAPPTTPRTYAIIVGSRAPARDNQGNLIPDAVRGDLDAAHIQAALDWATETHVIQVNWNDPDTIADSIQNAMTSFIDDIRAGDTLLFYYSGHGSGSLDSSVDVDEELNAISGGSYLDDTLTSLLGDTRLSQVKKVVFLDACFSGGFWKNDGDSDFDLETLNNVALLAAASENTYAFTDTDAGDGTGLWTNAFLPLLNPDTTYQQLADLTETIAAEQNSITGFFKDDGFGTGIWEPAAYFSPDFDPARWRLDGTVVPEPSSIIMCLLGYALLVGFGWKQRRRRK